MNNLRLALRALLKQPLERWQHKLTICDASAEWKQCIELSKTTKQG